MKTLEGLIAAQCTRRQRLRVPREVWEKDLTAWLARVGITDFDAYLALPLDSLLSAHAAYATEAIPLRNSHNRSLHLLRVLLRARGVAPHPELHRLARSVRHRLRNRKSRAWEDPPAPSVEPAVRKHVVQTASATTPEAFAENGGCDALTVDQTALFFRITAATRRPALPRRGMRQLALALRGVSDAQDLARMDGPTVRQCVGPACRAWVLDLKHGDPMLDPQGRFGSHLHRVPQAWMDQHPALWRFPVTMAVRLFAWFPDRPADREHLLRFASCVAEARTHAHNATKRHHTARVYASVCSEVLTLSRGLWLENDAGPLRTFPSNMSFDALVEVAARIIGRLWAEPARRATVLHADGEAGDQLGTILRLLNGALTHGVFEPTISANHGRLRAGIVLRRLAGLVERQPERYASEPPPRTPRARRDLTPADVTALLAACRTAREMLVLRLLLHTALRRMAIARLRLTDVWSGDPRSGQPLQTVVAQEKHYTIRRVTIGPELGKALIAYVRGDEFDADRYRYLLAHPRRPLQPHAKAAQQILAAVCRRAGIVPRFSPHQFRAFFVNQALQAGKTLEQAAKFLGHRSIGTTFRSYWTRPELDGIDALLLGEPATEQQKKMEMQWENEHLRREVAALLRDRQESKTPMPSPQSTPENEDYETVDFG